jgi:class 3 adenylate cyclase
VFRVASEPIDMNQGEIYQYVGDEMVITWTVPEGRPGARPLACFFAIERELAAAGPRFERDFSAVPRLRAALHAGPVVTGEVGVSRRAIVFHGDVMNTTARLEQAARELDRRFLVSGDALARLPPADGWVLEDLAPVRSAAARRRCTCGRWSGTLRNNPVEKPRHEPRAWIYPSEQPPTPDRAPSAEVEPRAARCRSSNLSDPMRERVFPPRRERPPRPAAW